MANVNIAGRSYPLKFGYGAFRTLGSYWELNGIQAVINEVVKTFPEPEKGKEDVELSFDAIDKLADIVNAGISNAGGEYVNTDDIADELMFNSPDQLEVVMKAFTAAIPGATDGKKKASQKKQAKPKAKTKK